MAVKSADWDRIAQGMVGDDHSTPVSMFENAMTTADTLQDETISLQSMYKIAGQ